MLDFALVWPGVHDPHRNGNGNGHHHHVNGDVEEDIDEGAVEGNHLKCVNRYMFYQVLHNLDDVESELTEMWLVPADLREVTRIYRAMTQCQSLHPDPNDSVSDDDEEEGMQSNSFICF